jgi:hypothetical protein
MDRQLIVRTAAACIFAIASPACAGPPYISDDPEPTDFGHYEIYAYTDGTSTRGGSAGETGIDFNYGAAPNLQLTAVIPLGYESPADGKFTDGLGNVELAAKYRFLHQADDGWDVSIFPRVFLPSDFSYAGTEHTSLFVPIWLEKDWDDWSTFGGGGCELNNGGGSKDFCQMGWVLAREVMPGLQLGAEIVHQTADVKGGTSFTGLGGGAIYDLNEHYHLMGYVGPGIENAAANDECSWYVAMQFTF